MNKLNSNDIEKIRNRLRDECIYSEEQIIKASIEQIEDNQWGDSRFDVGIPVLPKEFIKKVLINELGEVTKISAWLAFVLIGTGIEFLGKCIDKTAPDWDKERTSSKNFNDAIRNLFSLKKYEMLIKRPDGFELYKEFRCGLAHGMGPKGRVILSCKDEAKNLTEFRGAVNFHIDELYADFRNACEEVIVRDYPATDKMNRPRIFINMTIPIRK